LKKIVFLSNKTVIFGCDLKLSPVIFGLVPKIPTVIFGLVPKIYNSMDSRDLPNGKPKNDKKKKPNPRMTRKKSQTQE